MWARVVCRVGSSCDIKSSRCAGWSAGTYLQTGIMVYIERETTVEKIGTLKHPVYIYRNLLVRFLLPL